MAIDISIIIVNYNVQYFLEQCLNSIFKLSSFSGNIETIVIDNASQDGSVEMVRNNFPQVKLIENLENLGFSKANNMGFKIAKGRYILMLNPDTILQESTLEKCFEKMQSDNEIGVLGVRMVDGSGVFLPESKRGFPHPLVSFYKFSGIYKLFPNSSKFNAYYAGHIEESEVAEVDILCGAFMFMDAKKLSTIGMLDESFFMYGEDIDLSYKFAQHGFKVIYYPETTIIHFKGESTQKNSLKYSRNFYNAMQIFANKHFKDSKAKTYLKSLSIVIKVKAILSIIASFVKKIFLPLMDAVLIFSSLILISTLWANLYYDDSQYYSDAPLMWNFSLYTFIWMIVLYFGGAYDRITRWLKVLPSVLSGTVIILAIYGLMSSGFRSSRAIILIANFGVIIIVLINRFLYAFISGKKGLAEVSIKGKNIILIASSKESRRINEILNNSNVKFNQIIDVPVEISSSELEELIKIKNIDEIICNSKDLEMSKIISLMSDLGDKVAFKITGDESLGIIGSQSKNSGGEIYTLNIKFNVQEPSKKRMKRTLDFLLGFLIIIFSPLLVLVGFRFRFLRKIHQVILGSKSLVGYIEADEKILELPKLKSGLLPCKKGSFDQDLAHSINFSYAKDYNVLHDLYAFIYFFKD